MTDVSPRYWYTSAVADAECGVVVSLIRMLNIFLRFLSGLFTLAADVSGEEYPESSNLTCMVNAVLFYPRLCPELLRANSAQTAERLVLCREHGSATIVYDVLSSADRRSLFVYVHDVFWKVIKPL